MSATLTLYGIGVTVGAYALSRVFAKRFPSPFTTPVFFSTTLIVLVLLASRMDFEDYRLGGQTVSNCTQIQAFAKRHKL
jgi:putative effector of murein hydrolase